ncbi:MAG: iron-containing alcohol dehydrogenase [Victivallales bacterium]|nr:iron-containing alcohol dehydrogenase [Victivallales bacterium]
MIPGFNFFMPTRIVFGPGKLAELAELPLPGCKALIVIGAGGSMRRLGYLERVQALLAGRDVESVVFDKILPNPVSEHVAEGAAMARDTGCDFVIGLGGGSSMDSAKSIAVMAKNPGEYWDYIGGGSGKGMDPAEGALPIVAITTTAGTGTEADPWTVITKTETNEKIGAGWDFTFPTLSIVDPELMLTVPPHLTAFQGMDAFFHAAEGYLANIANRASDSYALDTIGLVAKWLPIAVADGSNLDARTALAWANTSAGIVESLSCCISHHSLEHAISAHHPELPHGAGLTMTSIAYFTKLAEKAPERFPAMARAMGEDVDALPEAERPDAFITALRKLIAAIGQAELNLASYGISADEADVIARNSMDTMAGLYALDPAEMTPDDVADVFRACFP